MVQFVILSTKMFDGGQGGTAPKGCLAILELTAAAAGYFEYNLYDVCWYMTASSAVVRALVWPSRSSKDRIFAELWPSSRRGTLVEVRRLSNGAATDVVVDGAIAQQVVVRALVI